MGEIHSLLKKEKKVVESFCQNQYLFNTFIQYWKSARWAPSGKKRTTLEICYCKRE